MFADWSFETFHRNKFRRSMILDGHACFSKHFVEFNFRGSRRIRENCENYAPQKFGAIRWFLYSNLSERIHGTGGPTGMLTHSIT